MIEQNGLIQILKTMTKTEKKKVMKTNLITAILASDIVHDPMEGLTSFFPIFSFFFLLRVGFRLYHFPITKRKVMTRKNKERDKKLILLNVRLVTFFQYRI